ncbi:MAG: LysR family transcriptional regulator [Hyphomonadaceae bacterium]|nr:LysR family transcriptional regulator [Hyphomonadaceae bacterium]
MDPFLVQLFLDVARHGSFAAAARARDVEPSSVSRAIARLEAALGVQLFQRTTRAMALTEAGLVFQTRAGEVMASFDRLAEDARSMAAAPSGLLRMTASTAFGALQLIPRLSGFRRAYPHLKLELALSDRNLDLIEERIDLAIRLGPSGRSDLSSERLFATRYHAVASPEYCASHGPYRAPADLTRAPVIALDLPDFRNRWRFRDASGAIEEVAVRTDLTIAGVIGVRAAALAGLGPALLANWMIADDLAVGALVDLFPDWRAAASSFDTAAWAITPRTPLQPRKTSVMLDFLRKTWGGDATA